MNLFNPRTFSTDWEVMVVDKLERLVNSEKLMAFAGVLRTECDLPVQIDWNSLEFAMGINRSFGQLWERVRTVTDRASQRVRDFDLDLFPAGAHPVEEMFFASHVHVGTIHDESTGIHLENQMMKYAPAFGALAANSPVWYGGRGEYKSYRIQRRAHGCTRPITVRDPLLSQHTWGGDAGPKLSGAPTLEVRITDCASSRRFLVELATFIAAYLHYRGTRVEEYRLSPREYRDCMTNRWAAARYGLQATFRWDGAARPVAEVLDEMLDDCAAELEALGARRADLGLVNAMIEKRLCQADFVLDLASRYPDPHCLASVQAKLARHWDVFDQYLEAAPALDPIPAPDEEGVLAEHLALIGEGTHFYRSREAMHFPPPVADEIVERMVQRGTIQREVTEHRGTVLSRTR
jgi:gamma-glutamyl:cysteine ligase YbdK (ATP-grasp superfamily)